MKSVVLGSSTNLIDVKDVLGGVRDVVAVEDAEISMRDGIAQQVTTNDPLSFNLRAF